MILLASLMSGIVLQVILKMKAHLKIMLTINFLLCVQSSKFYQ